MTQNKLKIDIIDDQDNTAEQNREAIEKALQQAINGVQDPFFLPPTKSVEEINNESKQLASVYLKNKKPRHTR